MKNKILILFFLGIGLSLYLVITSKNETEKPDVSNEKFEIKKTDTLPEGKK